MASRVVQNSERAQGRTGVPPVGFTGPQVLVPLHRLSPALAQLLLLQRARRPCSLAPIATNWTCELGCPSRLTNAKSHCPNHAPAPSDHQTPNCNATCHIDKEKSAHANRPQTRTPPPPHPAPFELSLFELSPFKLHTSNFRYTPPECGIVLASAFFRGFRFQVAGGTPALHHGDSLFV